MRDLFTWLTEPEDAVSERETFAVADSAAKALGEPTFAEQQAVIDAQREAEAELWTNGYRP